MPKGRSVMDEAAEFSLKNGFSSSLLYARRTSVVGFSQAGRHFEMGPDMRGMLTLIASYAIGRAIMRSSRNDSPNQKMLCPSASARRLQWAAEGKNDWEIGEVMNISEHGADKHLRSVRDETRSDQPHTSGCRSDPERLNRIKVREPVLSPSICHRHFLIII